MVCLFFVQKGLKCNEETKTPLTFGREATFLRTRYMDTIPLLDSVVNFAGAKNTMESVQTALNLLIIGTPLVLFYLAHQLIKQHFSGKNKPELTKTSGDTYNITFYGEPKKK